MTVLTRMIFKDAFKTNRMLLPFMKALPQIELHSYSQVDELRQKLEQKNKLIEKKTQEALLVGPTSFHF